MALDLRVEGGWRRWQGGLGLTNEPGDHRVTDDKWLSPATPGSSFHHELLCFPNDNTNTNSNTNSNTNRYQQQHQDQQQPCYPQLLFP